MKMVVIKTKQKSVHFFFDSLKKLQVREYAYYKVNWYFCYKGLYKMVQ